MKCIVKTCRPTCIYSLFYHAVDSSPLKRVKVIWKKGVGRGLGVGRGGGGGEG